MSIREHNVEMLGNLWSVVFSFLKKERRVIVILIIVVALVIASKHEITISIGSNNNSHNTTTVAAPAPQAKAKSLEIVKESNNEAGSPRAEPPPYSVAVVFPRLSVQTETAICLQYSSDSHDVGCYAIAEQSERKRAMVAASAILLSSTKPLRRHK
jgi:hypothetical protein